MDFSLNSKKLVYVWGFFFLKKEKKVVLFMEFSLEFKMIIMELRYRVMFKYLSVEDKRVKYNIDYLIKCFSLKGFY